MKMLKFAFVLSLLTAGFAYGAGAGSSQATIVAVRGAASIKASSTSPSQPAAIGKTLSETGSVDTSAGGDVTLKFFDGTVTVVQAKSSLDIVTLNNTPDAGKPKEKTVLRLRSGSLVATLDPAKKDISDYQVQTPKGVAAARGTVFVVTINLTGGTTAATLAGTITFTPIGGGAPITVSVGTATAGAGVLTVAQAVAQNPGLAADLAAAATSVATAIGQGGISNTVLTPDNANAVLTAVTMIATQADPTNATTIANNVQNALGTSGNANTQAVINAAANQGVSNSTGLPNPGGTPPQQPAILPPLDQQQIVVSPSK